MKTELFTVDRLEGNMAVCENSEGNMISIPLHDLPPEVQEGVIISLCEGIYSLDKKSEVERSTRIKQLADQLWDN